MSHIPSRTEKEAGSQSTKALLLAEFNEVRAVTDALASPLSAEDQLVQSMEDASPAKWHRAHTSWFFETFILGPHAKGYQPFDPNYGYLFNSYYDAIGARHPRPQRGLLTRPSSEEIGTYRAHVTRAIHEFSDQCSDEIWCTIEPLLTLGIHHEQQHQELLLMDILHAFSCNSLEPAYARPTPLPAQQEITLTWTEQSCGLVEIGQTAETPGTFTFDNEGPRHEVMLRPFRIANRLATNREWLAFMEDGGYVKPEFWLADGWAIAQQNGWNCPLYWKENKPGQWSSFGLRGRQTLNLDAPACHISSYEADAYATWADKRLPTEAEWEATAASVKLDGNLLPRDALRPLPASNSDLSQMIGDVWEHTRSPYTPYPGFKAPAGAVGEYNGKFMANQMVLRGGSCVTPGGHIRTSYRNFFYPHQRWMFAGVRLAEDI